MPDGLVVLGGQVALALYGVDVHYHRAGGVFHLLECLHESLYVVSFAHIHIVQSHCLEQVALRPAVCLAQQLQVFVQSAVVLRYRHLVVVDHNDYVRVKLRSHVKPLESLAAAQRAVADNRYHIFLTAFQVASLCKTAGKAHRRGCVSHHKLVVFAFRRFGVARNLVVFRRVEECVLTPCEHFVGVALVAHVEHHLVNGRVEHIMQGDRRLHHTQVRAYVSAVVG